MRKPILLMFFVAALLPIKANSSEDAVILEKGISSFAIHQGATVSGENGNYTIKFPKTDTIKETMDDQGKGAIISGTIPEYEAKAVKSGTFLGHDIYKINTTAIDAFLSFVYRKFKITDVSATSFASEVEFVPELRFFKTANAETHNIVFASTDPKTGLKNEIAGVKKSTFKSDIDVKGDKIYYNGVGNLMGASLQLFLFNAYIPELTDKISAVYDVVPDIDYSKIPTDVASITQSKSLLEIKNGEFSILGISANASVGSINNMKISDDKMTLLLDGKFVVSDIKVDVQADNIPQDIVIKYELGNISRSKSEKLQKLQEKLKKLQQVKNKTKEQEDEEKITNKNCTAAAEEVIKDIKLNLKARITYEKAVAEMIGSFAQSGDYLVGNGKILAKNFDLLYPDLTAQCEKDKQLASNTIPQSCIKNATSMAFRKHIDLQKRTKDSSGNTVDVIEFNLTNTGIYINGTKVRDAINMKLDKEKETK